MQFISQIITNTITIINSLLLSLLSASTLISPLPAQYLHSRLPNRTATPSAGFNTFFSNPSPPPTPTPPTPSPAQPPTPSTPNYQLEPDPGGQEGFYVIRNAPSEPMSSVQELNQAVNNYRLSQGLNQLYIDPQLCDIAGQRAVEIDSHFSHDGFDNHFNSGDYDYTGASTIGENLWQGSFSGVHIVEFGWDKSPGHRANLQRDWSRGCAGIYGFNAAFIFAK